ncbi:DUF4240 domain-containing protein [Nonomuraea sp. NN258]|uniref:DUF4240 domain-containing protein n=1 Tax=Nonomuraea antri TaxID=2730852 RepID=UPI0015680094|nr:DUF4240 domain-containing protein [Nonomuraea antri]NRQ30770.1 DUF4240 domain-containing protein [Nonomuraea antri]
MDTSRFWKMIEDTRAQVSDPTGDAVPDRLTASLAALPPAEIAAAERVFWDLMAASYRNPLWAAAYLINGGCSDDLFDYFRGWLISQGREVFERAVADPDTLAELPVVRAAAENGEDLECEEMLGVARRAHVAATGAEPPAGSFTVRYPELDPEWNFDFDDVAEMTRRLPRLAALYLAPIGR